MENKVNEYIPKAKPTMIRFISRAAIKIKENFYTVEYGEERQVNYDEVNLDKEREALINDCNNEINKQIIDIYESFVENN